MVPYYDRDGITIYHADYRDVIDDIAGDAVITDPPYGVEFQYEGGYDDSEHAYVEVVLEPLPRLLSCAPLSLITPGLGNIWKFPQPRWTVAWNKPGSTRRSSLRGFNTWEPVLVYGDIKRPVYQDALNLPTIANVATGGETGNHPCPKPYRLLTWLVEQFTDPGDLIIDPFMGSGTTIKAAAHMGRRAIGIDVVEDYCAIAVSRLAQQTLALEF